MNLFLFSLLCGVVWSAVSFFCVGLFRSGTIRENFSDLWFEIRHMGTWKSVLLLWGFYCVAASLLGFYLFRS